MQPRYVAAVAVIILQQGGRYKAGRSAVRHLEPYNLLLYQAMSGHQDSFSFLYFFHFSTVSLLCCLLLCSSPLHQSVDISRDLRITVPVETQRFVPESVAARELTRFQALSLPNSLMMGLP